MTLIQRRTLYISFFLIFFVVTPLLLAYSSGYRFNLKKKKIYETGSLLIETIPTASQVTLEGTPLTTVTPVILNTLKEGFYHIEISKPGFTVWRKSMYIDAKFTTFVKGVRLFPVSIIPLEFTPAKTILARTDLFVPKALSPNSQESLLIQRLELWVSTVTSDNKPRNIFLTRFSTHIKKAMYLDDTNILVLAGNTFYNVERDSRDVRNITELYTSKDPILDFGYESNKVYYTVQNPQGTRVYYFDITK